MSTKSWEETLMEPQKDIKPLIFTNSNQKRIKLSDNYGK